MMQTAIYIYTTGPPGPLCVRCRLLGCCRRCRSTQSKVHSHGCGRCPSSPGHSFFVELLSIHKALSVRGSRCRLQTRPTPAAVALVCTELHACVGAHVSTLFG